MNKYLILFIGIVLLMTIVFANTPQNTRDLLSKLGNENTFTQYKGSLPTQAGFALDVGNNIYIKNYIGKIESYTLVKGNKDLKIVRGRELKPPNELYVTEWALDAILGANDEQICISNNYLQNGSLRLSGPNAWTAGAALKGACVTQGKTSNVSVSGKNYYRVIPGQTGDEVCKASGLNCVGLAPEKSDNVCKAFHPGAKTQNIIHGSKHYWYCNGQNSITCSNKLNTCSVCNACNSNLTCADDPGPNWGNEIYVECSSGAAPIKQPQAQQPPAGGQGGAATLAGGFKIPTPPCNQQKLGEHCGNGSCGAGTTGSCVAGLRCDTTINRCTNIPPQPHQLYANGDRCHTNTMCQSNSCVFDHALDRYVCAGKRAPGKICQHAGECEDGLHCVYAGGQGPDRVHKCSCEMFSLQTSC